MITMGRPGFTAKVLEHAQREKVLDQGQGSCLALFLLGLGLFVPPPDRFGVGKDCK